MPGLEEIYGQRLARQPSEDEDPLMALLAETDLGQSLMPAREPNRKRQNLALAMMMTGGNRGMGQAGKALYADEAGFGSSRRDVVEQSGKLQLARMLEQRRRDAAAEERFNKSQEGMDRRAGMSADRAEAAAEDRANRTQLVPDGIGGFIEYNPVTQEKRPVDMKGLQPGQSTAPKVGYNNPPMKLTETEDKSRFYAQNMAEALPAIDGLVKNGYRPSYADMAATGPPSEGIVGKVRPFTPRALGSEDSNTFYTNGSKILASILRKESGAAIRDEEWSQYGPMYLPWPGDSERRVQEKLIALHKLVDNMAAGGGQASRYWQSPEMPSFEKPQPQMPQQQAPQGDVEQDLMRYGRPR